MDRVVRERGSGRLAQAAAFRDLNHNGTMEPYEDSARPVAERVG